MKRVDLHLHTTASDGRCSPLELVEHAAAAGIAVMAATDHDTTGSVDEVRVRAAERGIEAIPGIEITAVEDGSDVHARGLAQDRSEVLLRCRLVQPSNSSF